jgi:hypothetical protein
MNSTNLAQAAPMATAVVKNYKHPDIAQISGCPCSASAPFQEISYRAVQADIEHRNNFLPKAVLEPDSLKGVSSSKACGLWGLSMYEDPASLRDMIVRVEKTVKNFRKKIGDHYAEIALSENDGTRTLSNKHRHFDFYGYSNCEYVQLVKSVKPIF